MEKYNFKEIEAKWQESWEGQELSRAEDFSKKPKFYCLVEFPYPSGEGLHVGHPRSYTAMDILARQKRMSGHNVLYPIGWDAFGLPAENYAIKTGTHPKITTEKNIANFRRQLKSLGFSFDWSREVNTTDPKYYKWTQWIFLKFFEKGLAYKSRQEINWCTSCNVGLANEEVVDGECERCSGAVIRKDREQWMLKITKYADRLLEDLETVDYLPRIKKQQIDWIGKSVGINIDFPLVDGKKGEVLTTYTTRCDTIYSVTFLVIAPEHPDLMKLVEGTGQEKNVLKTIEKIKKQTEIERTDINKKKLGCFSGRYVINPVTNEKIPLYVANFVLMYGTGVVMADAHDQRDFEFAREYDIPLKFVISSDGKPTSSKKAKQAFTEDGVLFDSGEFSGLNNQEALPKILNWLEEKGLGKATTQYKLRDWVFSRQRYWGEPIPIINCAKCGYVPVPEKDLPVVLPEVEKYQTTKTGDSPLATMTEWVNVDCPKCRGEAKRETDTMPNWAGSSWYFLRYIDPSNDQALADPKKLKYWTPVDWYNGGMEHTTLHLLYSRFWHKFLFDIGVVPTPEPYAKRTSHGIILGEGGEKMSKSRGNVVNPDEVVNVYGADTFRLYEMFMGPFDQPIPWDTQGILGVKRFLEKVWVNAHNLSKEKKNQSDDLVTLLHQTIKKVTEDISTFNFNTAISQLMILNNKFGEESANKEMMGVFTQLLSPFAPHLAEELWSILGNKKSIFQSEWPKYDPEKIVNQVIEIPVQINSKIRARILIAPDTERQEVEKKALCEARIKELIGEQKIKKIIYVPNRLINITIDN